MGHLGHNIADAIIPLGVPPSQVGRFIGALMAHEDEALFRIEGVTPQVVGAGVKALKGTFSEAFKRVWYAAAGFVALAAICKFTPYLSTAFCDGC